MNLHWQVHSSTQAGHVTLMLQSLREHTVEPVCEQRLRAQQLQQQRPPFSVPAKSTTEHALSSWNAWSDAVQASDFRCRHTEYLRMPDWFRLFVDLTSMLDSVPTWFM